VIVAALSSASFRMVGPLYGQEVGLTVQQIAWFLRPSSLGGALAQYPVGWLADKYDRRWVLIWLSPHSRSIPSLPPMPMILQHPRSGWSCPRR
jgi:MFS family permease